MNGRSIQGARLLWEADNGKEETFRTTGKGTTILCLKEKEQRTQHQTGKEIEPYSHRTYHKKNEHIYLQKPIQKNDRHQKGEYGAFHQEGKTDVNLPGRSIGESGRERDLTPMGVLPWKGYNQTEKRRRVAEKEKTNT